MLRRLIDDECNDKHEVTVGVEFGSYLIRVQDKVLKMQVWDTAGQDCFRSITKIFYRGAHVVLLGYDLTRGMSFENLTDWLREIRQQCSPDVMLFLVGNKADLESAREVSKSSIHEFQDLNDILYATETSAKTGKNVDLLFSDCARHIFHRYKDRMHEVSNNPADLSQEEDGQQMNVRGSFSQSGGHKAGRFNTKRRKPEKKRTCKC